MKKIVSRGACLLLTLCLSLSTVGCKKSNESNKIKEGQSISSEEAGIKGLHAYQICMLSYCSKWRS